MASPLIGQTFNEFIDLLKEFCNSEKDREALIALAFPGESIVTDLDYTGSAVTFCAHCNDRLYSYEREAALIRLLETVRDRKLGPGRKHEADRLIRHLRGESAEIPSDSGFAVTAKSHRGYVFISYSREDLVFVNRLRADLDKHGIDYWIDRIGLVAGTNDWETGLREAIAKARGMVLIATPASRKSTYVRDEIAIARMHHKTLYPLWAGGDEWIDAIPMGLGYVQNIDMRDATYATGLAQLIAVLNNVTGEPQFEREVNDAPSPDPQNPYKGLLAFEEQDANKFFGRTALIGALTQRIESQLAARQARFLAVMGPSGAGKSSVVMAGLIPALKAGRIPGSAGWTYLPRIVPGTHPIEYLADALRAAMSDTPLSSIETDLNAPGGRMLHRLARQLPGATVVLYIDQFEELFTLTASEHERSQFISLISQAVHEPDGKLLVLLTMRADFLNYPLNDPLLGDLFNAYAEMVRPMTIAELYEAIERPARLPSAGLIFDDELVPEIVFALRGRDKALAGALPLLQFALERLFEEREGNRLTWDAYHRMGGVAGAIGTHSEAIFSTLPQAAQEKLGQVFIQLVSIDEASGEPTRRRASLAVITADPDSKILVDAFVAPEARLLQTGREGNMAYVEVAHEALLRSWQRLVDWIDISREDQLTIRRMEREAGIWKERGEPERMLPNAEEIADFHAACDRLGRRFNDPVLQAFIEPEQVRLYRELGFNVQYVDGLTVDVTAAEELPETSHPRRYAIGERLNDIGELRRGVGVNEGLPDILWLPVEGSNGVYKFEFGEFEVQPFFIAKYLTTATQLQTFLDSDWDNPEWWQGFPEKYQPQAFGNVTNGNANAPRDTISWYQSVAFGRWMNHKLTGLYVPNPTVGTPFLASEYADAQKRVPTEDAWIIGENAQIRIPTEWEWQWAAMNGKDERKYPWGDWDNYPRANTTKAGIQGRSTAVGMYPHGGAECGALDMAGNLWEWCLNDYSKPEIIDGYGNGESKVLRGGSFHDNQAYAAASYRNFDLPLSAYYNFGVRLVVAAPISAL